MTDRKEYNLYWKELFLQVFKIDSDVIIHRLTPENINCSDQFQNLLTNFKSLNKTVYLVSKIQPVDGILSLVKKTNKIKHFRWVVKLDLYTLSIILTEASVFFRFFFVLDNSVPGFSTNNPFYSKQLAKDLLVNVYQNGRWVTYKEFKFMNVINTQTSMKKTLLANLSNIL